MVNCCTNKIYGEINDTMVVYGALLIKISSLFNEVTESNLAILWI